MGKYCVSTVKLCDDLLKCCKVVLKLWWLLLPTVITVVVYKVLKEEQNLREEQMFHFTRNKSERNEVKKNKTELNG